MSVPSHPATAQPGPRAGLRWLADLPAEQAERELLACCASRRWAQALAAMRRDVADLDDLLAASDAVLTDLDDNDITEALSAHPRIGERAAGDGVEAGWSRREQSGAAHAPAATLAELRELNAAYEQRFGHVFLICATGLSAEQMLAALRQRLGNAPDTERGVVREELRRITRLRLGRLVNR